MGPRVGAFCTDVQNQQMQTFEEVGAGEWGMRNSKKASAGRGVGNEASR